MTLPASFPISASQINVELGRASNAAFDIQGSAERALAEVPSGAISMSDFLGKEFFGFARQGSVSSTTTTTTVTVSSLPFGPANASRKMFMAVHARGHAGASRSLSSATIGGIAATIHVQSGDHNSGTNATYRTAIISADVPTGTSGDVVLTWNGSWTDVTIWVESIRAKGLVGGIVDTLIAQCPSGCSSESGTINMPSNGCLLAASTGMSFNSPGTITMTPTETYTETNLVAGVVLSGQGANATYSVQAVGHTGGDPSIGLVAITWQGQ